MKCYRNVVLGVFGLAILAFGRLAAPADDASLNLTPETRELLRTEMREITRAMQDLVEVIATGRWDAAGELGARMASSFVLEQELSAQQREELETALPEHFRRLDRQFHATAKSLQAAAQKHDAKLITLRVHELLFQCTACHEQYARSVFPGFVTGRSSIPEDGNR